MFKECDGRVCDARSVQFRDSLLPGFVCRLPSEHTAFAFACSSLSSVQRQVEEAVSMTSERCVSRICSGPNCVSDRMARARARMARAKGKGKKGDKSKDQKPISKPEQFQGYCGYCEKWGHKRANCRKRIDDAKSNGGAAASADDGDVAAVMEVDDVVMRAGDDETSLRSYEHVCCCGINRFSFPGQRK